MAHFDSEVVRLWGEFHSMVNMSSPDLRAWLGVAPDDQDAYLYDPDVEAPALGRDVLVILSKRRVDLNQHDIAVMRLVLEVLPSWLSREPPHSITDDPWRCSLMCLGYDPLKGQPFS
jgi:hypothetical protein